MKGYGGYGDLGAMVRGLFIVVGHWVLTCTKDFFFGSEGHGDSVVLWEPAQ